MMKNFSALSPDLKLSVPPISDELLAIRLARFTAYVLDNEDITQPTLQAILKPEDARRTSLIWEPEFIGEPRPLADFVEMGRSQTHHRCGYYGFFKPSLAEVLAQVPDDLPPGADSFYIDTMHYEMFAEGDGHRVWTVFGRMGG